ncbi:MAG TPA: hypothetical protein VF453_02380 [Burkholderiaceae bacterium]
MPHPLSTLGAAHTALSLVPLAVGLREFVRFGGIDPARRAGRVYLGGLALSVFTSFGLSSTGGFNPGHALGILALGAAFGGALAARRAPQARVAPYLAAFGLSFSFFLLLVPGINETLTRLPPAHPLADGPASPVVRSALLAWLAVFACGFVLQVRRLRRADRPANPGI